MCRFTLLRISWLWLSLMPLWLWAQPANDDCANAQLIPVPGAGYGYGLVVADTVDMTTATAQPGEYFSPGVPNGKSVWYRFSLPTTREVQILLSQDSSNSIPQNDAGWTLYRNGSCLPGVAEVVDPPIFQIEGFTHACLREGEYLLQISSDLNVNGELIISLDVRPSSATEVEHDFAAHAYDFQVVSGTSIAPATYEVGCQSIFAGENICGDSSFTKSTWHTFTTDNVVDLLRLYAREFPFDGSVTAPRRFGFNLYLGDARLDSTGLIQVGSCDTLAQTSSSNYQAMLYPCELLPNTTYSVQLLFDTDYFGNLEVGLDEIGGNLTQGPDPAALPPSHQLGLLTGQGTYSVTDYFACNALMSTYACGTIIPDTITAGSYDYDLNWWTTFEIDQEQNVRISWQAFGQPGLRVRIFDGDAGLNCTLPLVGEGSSAIDLPCLAPGVYSVQVLGTINAPSWPEWTTSLGKSATLNVELLQQEFNAYTLSSANDYEAINGGNPLVPGTTYPTTQNFIDCQTTIMPAGDSCQTGNDRAMYRVFDIPLDGYIRVSNGNWSRFTYRIYRGNASTLPVVGGQIQGLTDQVCCRSLYWYTPVKLCVTPGTYTLVTYGDPGDVNYSDNPTLEYDTLPALPFSTPALAEVMDTLSLSSGPTVGTAAYFTCTDNVQTVLGYAPCGDATKMLFREFYLADPASIDFDHLLGQTAWSDGQIRHRLFSGRASNGGLTGLVRDCFTSFDQSSCDFMAAGWYTVVTYGDGETFTDPTYCNPERGEAIGDQTNIQISINAPYQSPQFNTFLNAETINGGNPLTWGPRQAHTDTIPKQDTVHTLGTEYFNCIPDTPFPAGIIPCQSYHNRVSYRVFTLTQPAFVRIENTAGIRNGQSRLYDGDITTQTAPFTVNEDCFGDDFWKCMAPGTYTLVSFYSDSYIGSSITPRIYVDSLGTSRYDHAAQAYDYGNIPLNGTEYRGAPGTGLDPLGRPGSNDFIFCSTGAYDTEPVDVCPIGSQTMPYTLPMNVNPRQTLWYTFEVTGPGSLDVSVYGLTPGKPSNLPFAVYRVPNNVMPLVDSTDAELEFIVSNQSIYCWNVSQSVNIFRDPCSSVTTDRYVVLVDRYAYYNAYAESNWPNMQVQVGVRFSNIPGTSVLYDHYSQANLISGSPTTDCNAPYDDTTLTSGTFTGCEGNLTCATQDATDQNSCGQKTIWYRMEVGSSGLMRLNFTRTDNGQTGYDANDIQLYRQVTPGDSSTSGLQRVPLNQVFLNNNPDFPGSYLWGSTCYSAGTYYVMITGCNFPNATVYPRVWLENYPGDFCSDSIGLVVDSTGSFQATGTVDCWTIGESPGESQPELGCAGTPIGKKTGWFHISITDTAKMDLDVSVTENTTATSLQVQYRVGNGSCDLMTFENCVDDVFITLNLKCRRDSGLWIQVILPENASGDVTLNVDATPSPDQNCEPINPFAPNASFDFTAGCAGTPVDFVNQSSVGMGMNYLWDFGDGFTSTFANPSHTYAVADTYLVSLVVSYDTLADTSLRQVIVYPVPMAGFSLPDTVIADNPVLISNASSNTLPSATYYWEFCAGGGFCSADFATHSGLNPPSITYAVPGSYEICLTVTNGNCADTICQTITVITPNFYGGGPYDGFDQAAPPPPCDTLNFFSGGPYDGFDEGIYDSLCEELNFYAGGPYDGFDRGADDSPCDTVTMLSIWAGGPRDGEGQALIDLNCPDPPSLWAGGPQDGAGQALLRGGCESPNFYTGGPYDGFDQAAPAVACQTPNFFTGGPYDGFDRGDTACETLNFFAGGPYDGTDLRRRGSGGLDISDVTICLGDTITVQASGSTDWYLSQIGGTPIAYNIDSLTLAGLAESIQLYVNDQCNSNSRLSAAVHVVDTLDLDFAFTANCVNNPTFFANQALVPGPSQATVGTELMLYGGTGTAPGFNQLSVSQGFTYSFDRLHDGLNNLAWYGNNADTATVWLQWQYFVPKSVDRIQFWNDGNFPQKFPVEARLYFADGGPWQLVKVFDATELQTTQFDSYNICESRDRYAQRWKLELDVVDPNSPRFTEFQVMASEPTTSGPVEWDFGDGSPPIMASSPMHWFPNPGTYEVTMRMPGNCGCDNEVRQMVSVASCNILSELEQALSGRLLGLDRAVLDWQVEGDFTTAYLEKYLDRQWVTLTSFAFHEGQRYAYTDEALLYDRANLYRMRVLHEGETVYSNQVSLRAQLTEAKLNLFPNPVADDAATLSLHLPQAARIEVHLLNNLGQHLGRLYRGELRAGVQALQVPVAHLAEGQYFLRVNVNQYPYVLRMMVR